MHLHTHGKLPGRVLKISLAVTFLLVVGEMAAGVWATSLALISDAWHNLTDMPSMALALLALYFEKRPPTEEKTYGYHRAGVLAAFVNSLLLLAVAAYLFYEAFARLMNPQAVGTTLMVVMGAVALAVNGGITWALARSSRTDLNLRAVFIHNLGDAASNLAVIAGAVLIRYTGQNILDPVMSALIGGLIVWSAWGILRESANILLEGLPKGLKLKRVAGQMLSVSSVEEVHDIHIWSLNVYHHALSCHVLIHDMATSESEKIRHQLRELLSREFNITHCTIQFEHTHPPGEFHRYMPEPAPIDQTSAKPKRTEPPPSDSPKDAA